MIAKQVALRCPYRCSECHLRIVLDRGACRLRERYFCLECMERLRGQTVFDFMRTLEQENKVREIGEYGA